MRKNVLKKIYYKRLLCGEGKLDVMGSEALFLILLTLVEICFPIYFLIYPHHMSFFFCVITYFLTIFALFFIFMDIQTFFKRNYIDLLFLHVIIYFVSMFIALLLLIWKRELIAQIVEMNVNAFGLVLVILVAYVILLLGSFLIISLTDFFSIIMLLLLAYVLKLDIRNPYLEKMEYAQSIEGSQKYTTERIKAEYEGMFQESSINEEAFEVYCREQHSTPSETFIQPPLFDDTKHFKQIVSLEQVKTRYDTLMQIYKGNNESENSSQICKEIEREYKEIKKKYNI